MKIAIVDVGTNTTRLLIAEVQNQQVSHEILRRSTVTRLGAGVDATGRLSEEALAREHDALTDYAETIKDHRPARTVAVMTSAVRDAANGPDFARQTQERYGFDARILTGSEEANLTYRGALAGLPEDRTRLVADIGGGSTELIIGRGPEPRFHVSTQAGVVRQSDRHIRSDPPTEEDLRAVTDDVTATLAEAVPESERHGIDEAIAVAGTPTSLAAVSLELDPYDPERVHGYRLTDTERQTVLDRLHDLPLSERQRVKGLHPARAQVILPGAVILGCVMRLFGLEAVMVSEHDILRGAAVFYAD